jgi:hypothetical protein
MKGGSGQAALEGLFCFHSMKNIFGVKKNLQK